MSNIGGYGLVAGWATGFWYAPMVRENLASACIAIQVAQRGVFSEAVVKHFDIFEDVRAQL